MEVTRLSIIRGLRLKLNFIVGFPTRFVNPAIVADTLNSFCIALYCKGMSVTDGFIEVFGGKRGFLTAYPVVLMQRDPSTEVSSQGLKNQGFHPNLDVRQLIISEMMAYGPLSHNPWGVPKPECPKCKTNINVQARIRNRGKVSWKCTCGMISQGSSRIPSCVRQVAANWLNDFYWVDYPVPVDPHQVDWKEVTV